MQLGNGSLHYQEYNDITLPLNEILSITRYICGNVTKLIKCSINTTALKKIHHACIIYIDKRLETKNYALKYFNNDFEFCNFF